MVIHGCVRCCEVNRAFQKLFSQIKPIHLEVNPPETVQEGTVDGIRFDGFLNHRQGFLEFHLTVREHVAEVIQNGWVVLIKIKGSSESLLSFSYLVLTFV